MSPSLLLMLALGATSKLGPVVYSQSTSDVTTVLASCPKAVRWVLSDSVSPQAVDQLRASCGYGVEQIVAVSSTCGPFDLADNAVQSADDCWQAIYVEAAQVTPNGIWLEGPYGSFLPGWSETGAPAWLAVFWDQLAYRISGQGFKPLLPAYGVTDGAQLEPLVEKLKKRSFPWGWATTAYTSDLSVNVCRELDDSLAYRALRDAAGLTGKPLFLTEAGFDEPGWQVKGVTEEDYLEWLRWFDSRLQEDSEVEGATLFLFGDDGSYADYSLAPLAEEIAAHLDLASIPAIPPGDTTCGSPDGGVDASVPGESNPSPGTWSAHDSSDEGCSCQSASAATLSMPLLFLAAGLLLRGSQGKRED